MSLSKRNTNNAIAGVPHNNKDINSTTPGALHSNKKINNATAGAAQQQNGNNRDRTAIKTQTTHKSSIKHKLQYGSMLAVKQQGFNV
jgi:hypothetical protein